jgi:hypothetical protein
MQAILSGENLSRAALQYDDVCLHVLYVGFFFALLLDGDGLYMTENDFLVVGDITMNVGPACGACQRRHE